MKFLMITAVLAITAYTTTSLAADVGVSVSIGQPGFYGRLDMGGYSQPRVIYAQPRIVEQVAREREPIYLHVPSGYARNWRNHCDEYNACGERVYFVVDSWYNHEYVPYYHEHHVEYDHEGNYDNNNYGDDHQHSRHEDRHGNNDHEDDHHNDHGDEN